jgi:cytochrome P450
MIKQEQVEQYLVPPGPIEQYNSADELLFWLKGNSEQYGPIYRASVFGSSVYVVSAPEYCEYILRRNWQNYLRKGLVVRRIAMALGNNLITSNGASWASQRRMIHPSFTKQTIGRLNNMISGVNAEFLYKWREAAQRGKTVNVTRDVSVLVLKITLIFIFGDDYETVAPDFKFFVEESARDFEFAQTIRSLRELVIRIVTQRRSENRISEDSLGVMMQARDRDSREAMPDAQLAREVMNLVVAGHETTASLLNWMWYLLATHPEVQTRLGVEFDQLPWDENPTIDAFPKYTYTRRVIDEALRLYPPLWLMTRRALNDDKLGEYFVPAGTEIYI